jgi:hypothetical protein
MPARRCLLTVHAHPDDESEFGGGTVARYLAGRQTSFPEAGPPWQPSKLYYTVTSAQTRQAFPAQTAADVFGREEFILARDLTQRQHGLTDDLEADLFAGVA